MSFNVFFIIDFVLNHDLQLPCILTLSLRILLKMNRYTKVFTKLKNFLLHLLNQVLLLQSITWVITTTFFNILINCL